MPNGEDIVRAIGGLETLHGQLAASTNKDIKFFNESIEGIEEMVFCVNTALQILNKRLDFHAWERFDDGGVTANFPFSPKSPLSTMEINEEKGTGKEELEIMRNNAKVWSA